MVAGAARLKFEKFDASAKIGDENWSKKLDFQRKLRDYQRRSKGKRVSVAKFAKKHGFSVSSVRRGLKGVAKRSKRLQQRLEMHQNAIKMERINGSAILRAYKRPLSSLRTINRMLEAPRVAAKLKRSQYWNEIRADLDAREGEMELSDSEWKSLFQELDWIETTYAEGGKIPKSKLSWFKKSSWANRLFGRKG